MTSQSNLPVLFVEIEGRVLKSNFNEFRSQAFQFIESINVEIDTDDHFAQAEADIKTCAKAEEALLNAKNAVIAQTVDIENIIREIGTISGLIRDKRLFMEKKVKTRKEDIKREMIDRANADYQAHVRELEALTSFIKLTVPFPDFAQVIKGKQTRANIANAIDSLLTSAKIKANDEALKIQEKINWFANYFDKGFLFPDMQTVVQKPLAEFMAFVETRIADYEKAEAERIRQQAEAERERIRQEEERKAREYMQAEADAIAEAAAIAEAEKKQTTVAPELVVVANQDLIAEFLVSRGVDKETEKKVRPWLVEFVKFSEAKKSKLAAAA